MARLRELRLLPGNREAWQARRDLIAQARQQLDLAYFILEDDTSSNALLDDLQAAAARGVQVRLLADHLMVWPHAAMLQARAMDGLQIRLYRPPAAAWLAQLQQVGIDAQRFLVGLSGADTGLLLQSLAGCSLVPAAWVAQLREIAQAPTQLRLAHALQVLARLQQLAGDAPAPPAYAGLAQLQAIVKGLGAYLHRSHHKLLLADQRRFIMGGRNLADAYHRSDGTHAPPFRDLDLQACDSRARCEEHAAAFEALWALGQDVRALDAPTVSPAARAVATPPACVAGTFDQPAHPLPDLDGCIVNSLPGSATQAAVTEAYTACIRRFTARGAPGAIDIVSAYLFLDDVPARSSTLAALRQSLLDAAAVDGITVNLYTNSLASTDLKPVNAAFYQCMGALIAGGVRVHELRPGHGSLHAKAAAVGDDCLLVGSYNFDPRSELYDSNNLAVLHDPGGQATAAWRALWTAPDLWTPVTAEAAAQLQAQTEPDALRYALLSRLL